ncbi:MAG: hypothetical protein HC828_13445 [Blastochloris sp.]|nr:hypothetical protein [Blastochloris sp.]
MQRRIARLDFVTGRDYIFDLSDAPRMAFDLQYGGSAIGLERANTLFARALAFFGSAQIGGGMFDVFQLFLGDGECGGGLALRLFRLDDSLFSSGSRSSSVSAS